QQRCEVLSDIPEQIDFIDAMPEYDLAMYVSKKMKTTPETSKDALETMLPVLEAISAEDFTKDAIHAALFALIAEKGVKNGLYLWPLRVAISGKQFTPGGGIELAAVMGKEKTVARVKAALKRL
ncbi:MAG: glutamate--tRNA ligase, partial [Ruthenibacterium sp.]